MIKRGFRALLASLMLLAGLTFAQSLARLAPADTILSLGWSSQSKVMQSLSDDLAGLDWLKAGESLRKIATVLSEAGDFADIAELLGFLQAGEGQDEMWQALNDACPAFADLLPQFGSYQGQHVAFEALLTVGMSAFNPLPSVTALLHLDASYAQLMRDFRAVMLDCLEDSGELEISLLEQDGVDLYVIGDAGDFPVVIGSLDNLFFASTNPEALRAVIRKVKGSDEASFADSRLAQEMLARFDQTANDLSFSLDLAKIAEIAEGFAAFVIDGPETEYLVNRGLAMLKTLGGVAGKITANSEGLLAESLWTINPDGGDSALANYILCKHCKVSSPFLAASGAVSASSAYLPWRELYSYAETWLQGVSEITGEPLNLKRVLKDEFGFDLDIAAFNWLGSDFHMVVLEPVSSDLKTLLYNPAQYMFVPVSSVEAAKAGIAHVQESLMPFIFELARDFDVLDELQDELGLEFLESMIAVRPYDYRGTEINRIQFSLNGDVGYGFVGNYLVLASPAKALERAVDTFMGGRTLMSDGAYSAARAQVQDVSSFYYSNDQVQLQGIADVLEVVSQPLAFGTRVALEASLNDPYDDYYYDEYYEDDYSDDYESEPYYADLYEIEAQIISAPGEVSGELTEQDIDNLGYITDFYQITDLNPGDWVTVRVRTESFDSYTWLIDANSSEYLDENDDSVDDYQTSELSFRVEEGRDYWVEISSYSGDATGEYSLTILIEPFMADLTEDMDMTDSSDIYEPDASDDWLDADESYVAPELPSFAELLDFFELFPGTVRVLASHLSSSEGYSVIDATTVYSRGLTRIRW